MMSDPSSAAAALVAEALGLSAAEIDEGTALGVTPQWDSLAHMRLILALEQRLGRRLAPEAIVGLADFGDVVALLDEGP